MNKIKDNSIDLCHVLHFSPLLLLLKFGVFIPTMMGRKIVKCNGEISSFMCCTSSIANVISKVVAT